MNAYELRGSLKLINHNYSGAVSDFETVLKYCFRDYESAYEGGIFAYLMNGNTQQAKIKIEKYNKLSYYQFADCTTYPDMIILNLGDNDKITYSSSYNNELANYMVNKALSNYTYIVSRLYSDIWGGTYFELKELSLSPETSSNK